MSITEKLKTPAFWLKVTAYIAKILLQGANRSTAFLSAASYFGVSVQDIKKNVNL